MKKYRTLSKLYSIMVHS